MANCNCCTMNKVEKLLDLGRQPISNRFQADYSGKEESYPLIINQCEGCGLIQINDPVPAGELIPRYDWITYSEPEAHLDHLADTIIRLEGIKKDSGICGITFKDDPLLERLRNRGIKNTWRIDKKDDLHINNGNAGLETIQEYIRADITRSISKGRGLADVVIVRHILEHAHNTRRFIEGIKELVKPQGYIIFEVPDCADAFEKCDYTTIWEEHILYFTQRTFKSSLAFCGLKMRHFQSYPNAFENSLVAVTQIEDEKRPAVSGKEGLDKEISRAKDFSGSFPGYSQKVKEFMQKKKRDKGKIAIFGAGHLASTFISLFKVEDLIDFCVDDNQNKRNLYLPGTRLPIYASRALIDKDVNFCLLTLNPMNEDKVIKINSDFVERGGVFLSIFPVSKRAIQGSFIN